MADLRSSSALDLLPVGVYICDKSGSITQYNRTAARLWGREPGPEDRFCGSYRLHSVDGKTLSVADCPMVEALKSGESVQGQSVVIERPDGSRITALVEIEPLRDSAGELVGAVNMFREIPGQDPAASSEGALAGMMTALADRPDEVQPSLAQQRLAAIVESSDDAIISKDMDGIITTWNRGAEVMYGYTAEEAVGQPVSLIIPPDRQDEEPRIMARLRRGERVDHYETVRRRKDGSLVDISLAVSPIRGPDGIVVGASKIARDITERRRAEERQRLLLGEMNHRVKNLLVLAGSIVGLAARSASGVQQLAADVRERLGALARAHELILPKVPEQLGFVEASTTLHALIGTIAAPFTATAGSEGGRVCVEGEDIRIAAGSPLTGIALLLHEFMINAAKHGALSVPDGRVEVRCTTEGERLIIVWSESGGPVVGNDPRTLEEGFGSRLVRLTLQGQLGGQIEREWRPEGLRIWLSVTRASLEA